MGLAFVAAVEVGGYVSALKALPVLLVLLLWGRLLTWVDKDAPDHPRLIEWFCDACSFRPWIDFADATSATVTFVQADGTRSLGDRCFPGKRRPFRSGGNARQPARARRDPGRRG